MAITSNEKPLRLVDILVQLSVLCILSTLTVVGYPDVCYDNSHYTDPNDVHVKFAAVLGLQHHEHEICTDNIFGVWQHALAMKWAVSMLNGQLSNTTTTSFIPRLKIGLDIVNDCSIVSRASLLAGQLMSGHADVPCGLQNGSSPTAPLVGVIGTTTSKTTTVVANVLRHHHLPLVGVSATVQDLADKSLYPMFIRAVPSDTRQAQLIIEMAKKFQWFYMMGIHSDTVYGRLGMKEVNRLAVKERICMTESREINEDFFYSEAMEDLVRTTIFTKLDQTKGTLGVVFFGEHQYFINLLEVINKKRNSWPNADHLSRIHWILSDAVSARHNLHVLLAEHKNKVFLISPPNVSIPSFVDYLTNLLSDPPHWLTDRWKRAIGQSLAVSFSCPDFNFTHENVVSCQLEEKMSLPIYLSAAIDSVYILASLLKQAHTFLCQGSEGLCKAMKDAIQKGLLTDFSLQDIAPISYEDIGMLYAPEEFVRERRVLVNVDDDLKVFGQPLYSITEHNSSGYHQIANLNDDESIYFFGGSPVRDIPSECKNDCPKCEVLNSVPYEFKSGTVIMIGFFSLHVPSEISPFQCGPIRYPSVDFIAKESFVNALNWLRAKTKIDFGYLIIDDCYSPVRATKILSDILGGDTKIFNTAESKWLELENIWVVIGALSSSITLTVLPQIKELYKPMISYSASSPILDDKFVYPYFSRALPSDTLQAQALVEILKGMKAVHVGAIVLAGVYGQGLYNLFRQKAEKEKICVEEAFAIDDFTAKEDMENVLGELGAKNVKIIVVFVSSNMMKKVLETEKNKEYNFHFVISEAVGLNQKILSGQFGDRVRGSLLLVAATPKVVDLGFKDHLYGLDPFSDDAPVWLREFWEGYFQCNMIGSFTNAYTTTCKPNDFSTRAMSKILESFVLDSKSQRTAIATMAAGYAINNLMEEQKNLVSKGFGPDFAMALTEAIRQVDLPSIDGKKIRPLDDKGNAKAGFEIYNIQRTDSGYDFVSVGIFQSNSILQMNWPLVKFYKKYGEETSYIESTCDCQICHEKGENPIDPNKVKSPDETPEAIEKESTTDSTVLGLGVGCGLLVILLIIMIVLIGLRRWDNCTFRQKKKEESFPSISYDGSTPQLPLRPTRMQQVATSNDYVSSSEIESYAPNHSSSNEGTTVSGGASSIISERTLDNVDKVVLPIQSNPPLPPRPHHKVVCPIYVIHNDGKYILPEFQRSELQMQNNQPSLEDNGRQRNLIVQMPQQNADTNIPQYAILQESPTPYDLSKTEDQNGQSDHYSKHNIHIPSTYPISSVDEYGRLYNRNGVHVGFVPQSILNGPNAKAHNISSSGGISNQAYISSPEDEIRGNLNHYKLTMNEDPNTNRSRIPCHAITGSPITHKHIADHHNLYTMVPGINDNAMLFPSPQESGYPAPHKPPKFDDYLDPTVPPFLINGKVKSYQLGPSHSTIKSPGLVNGKPPPIQGQERFLHQILKPLTPHAYFHTSPSQQNNALIKSNTGSSIALDTWQEMKHCGQIPGLEPVKCSPISNTTDTGQDVKYSGQNPGLEPVTCSLISNTTDTSEEDNYCYKIVSPVSLSPRQSSSFTSNPISLGFHPNSKSYVSSERRQSDEMPSQRIGFTNLGEHVDNPYNSNTSLYCETNNSPSSQRFKQILEFEEDLREESV